MENQITYRYIYTVAGFDHSNFELEIEATHIEKHENVMPFIRHLLYESWVHVEAGTFALDITLGLVRVQIIRK